MNRTLRTKRVIELVFAWCVVVYPLQAFAANNGLRFDGLYCCQRDSSVGPATFYLRFYPDGIVVSVLSTGTPREVAKWFNRQKQPNFRYAVEGLSLRFREETEAMIFDYSGTIDADSLNLRVDGYDHPTKASMGYVRRSYKFVQVPLNP